MADIYHIWADHKQDVDSYDFANKMRKFLDGLVEMGRIFGCSRWKIIAWIVVPAAMPEIITGIRLAVVRAVKGVIVGQIVIALIGFGGLFSTYLSYFLMERFWALIIVVFAMSFTIIGLVELLERRIAFYAKTR